VIGRQEPHTMRHLQNVDRVRRKMKKKDRNKRQKENKPKGFKIGTGGVQTARQIPRKGDEKPKKKRHLGGWNSYWRNRDRMGQNKTSRSATIRKKKRAISLEQNKRHPQGGVALDERGTRRGNAGGGPRSKHEEGGKTQSKGGDRKGLKRTGGNTP